MKAIVYHQAVITFRVSSAGFEMPQGPSLSKNSRGSKRAILLPASPRTSISSWY